MLQREFFLSNWAIRNRVTVYVLAVCTFVLGIYTYVRLPKELLPDVVIPTILVTTVYPGTSPADVENLVTRPIEKQLKAVAGVTKVRSYSAQDVSTIVVEFETDVDPALAKQRVQDAVDRAKAELPTDLPEDPRVLEIEFSEFPIMQVSIAGDIPLVQLKRYAEEMRDRIESLPQIRRVDLVGVPEREVRVEVDPYRLWALGLSLSDVEQAIRRENLNLSAGELSAGGLRLNVRLTAEFRRVEELANILVRGGQGNTVRLGDIATVVEEFKEQQSYARLNRRSVITLSVVKKAGENLLEAAEQIYRIVEEFRTRVVPPSVQLVVTNDQSERSRTTLADLNNAIILGFLFVVLALMFFMGVRNALFVGLATPLSAFLAMLVLPGLGVHSFNIVVTFALLLALGIIVDDAIVVVENIYRLYRRERLGIVQAVKQGAGEVFAPVLAGTLTTLAPFVPLLFWPGVVGQFLFYLPVVMISTLAASFLVAYVFNPVFAHDFMPRVSMPLTRRQLLLRLGGFLLAAAVGYGLGFWSGSRILVGMATVTWVVGLLWFVNRVFFTPYVIEPFQQRLWPRVLAAYQRLQNWILRGRRPVYLVAAVIVLAVVTFLLFGIVRPKVTFFTNPEPNFVYVSVTLPIGTDAAVTDSIMRVIEERVYGVLGETNPLVSSVSVNVGIAAGDPFRPSFGVTPHQGRLTVAFVGQEQRRGMSTWGYLEAIRRAVADIRGAEVVVDKDHAGPPTGKPINIEIAGDDLDTLAALAERVRSLIVDSLRIAGIEQLVSDLQQGKPELQVVLNREKAVREGLNTAQIGGALRAALYGVEASKFRAGDEEYPINVRLMAPYRQRLEDVLNVPIAFRDLSTGQFRVVPASAVSTATYATTYGSITRINQQRVVTLSSNVLPGYSAPLINAQIRAALQRLSLPAGYSIRLTGEQEEQRKTLGFLQTAFLVTVALIAIILVTEFNSVTKPLLVLTTVVFSTVGVFLGFLLSGLTLSIALTGLGIVSLAGVVVRNGVVLVDYIEQRRAEGLSLRQAVIRGGATRVTPVLLTAAATILGLLPLAVGLNMDFGSLLTRLDPKLYFGGFSAAFWEPLAWAIIFGLIFATFLTLVVLPVLYYLAARRQLRRQWRQRTARA
ncbi:Multidrug resistance protein MdtC [bacterium HR21]|nr:Multidrug resistance protein MdtC [bacterium HR21]